MGEGEISDASGSAPTVGEGARGEFRLFGPPGTGKTTWLTRQLQKAAQKYGPQQIIVASFTKAAARVLVGRDLPVPDEQIGTLHAHCYRALGRPKIADVYLKEFAEEHGLLMTGAEVAPSLEENSVEQGSTNTQDDKTYLELGRLRNLMVPKELWPASVQHFDHLWSAWKKEHEMLDFTDLIEVALKDMLYAPRNATVGFFDEAQDSSPLQHRLMRNWGKSMDFFILAGDDDQCLYSFIGARPETLVSKDLPEERKLFLRQSWRVPRAVQAYAERVIAQVGRRQPKEYRPREEEGVVGIRFPARWRAPNTLVTAVENDLANGNTVMVIAPCSYALTNIIAEFRRRAIPFGNPYRTTRGDWNPLAMSRKRESALSRVLDFLEPKHELRFEDMDTASRVWSAKQLVAWTKLVDTKAFFARGFTAAAKKIAKEGKEDAQAILELLWQYANNPDYINSMIRTCSIGSLEERIALLRANFMPSGVGVPTADYAFRCIEGAGGDMEKVRPRVCVGTVHSVKGAESDVVYLIPDVPMNVYNETLVSREAYDSSVRVAYVAITRAKKAFHVLQPETRFTLRGIYV